MLKKNEILLHRKLSHTKDLITEISRRIMSDREIPRMKTAAKKYISVSVIVSYCGLMWPRKT